LLEATGHLSVILDDVVSTIMPPGPQLVSVTSYSEVIWYANADPSTPQTSPDPQTTVPIPIPHTQIEFKPSLTGNWNGNNKTVVVGYAWQDVVTLIASPSTLFSDASPKLDVVSPAMFPKGSNLPLLIEDANGNGETAHGSTSADQTSLQLSGLPSPP